MNNCAENSCNGGCKPARYSQGFPSCTSPMSREGETDTILSIDTPNAVLNYKGEKHTDQITGSQLGGIININDLRDVDLDYDFDAMCAEFIYHKFGECGDGCKSLEDAWNLFSIDQEGAKQDGIRYVRGANAYGCPVFLDTPSNQLQYWYAGWRPNGQFGYYQPAPVDKLPTIDGDPIIVSQDPNTKQPLVGTFPLTCLLDNLMNNFGLGTEIGFQKIKSTPQYEATVNNSTGEFDIMWNDWYYNFTQHVGTGHITGRVNWDYSFNRTDGDMSFKIKSVDYYQVYYVTDKGAPTTAEHIFLTLNALPINGSGQTPLVTRYEFTGRENWNIQLNQSVAGSGDFTLKPGQSMGPFNFLYMLVDWEADFDDEGYLNLTFTNKLNGWIGDCFPT